jgi:hypothetical protein
MQSWKRDLPEAARRFERLQAYFSPLEKTNRVIIVPAGTILSPKDGHGFHIGGTTVIMSHVGAFDNADHEFLHGIVNGIVRRLLSNLTAENLRKIPELARKKLVDDYETPESILDEELIRTYNDHIKRGENPLTFPEFSTIVNAMTEEQFHEMLRTDPETSERIAELGIASLSDLRVRAQEYYDAYEKDILRERIAKLYRQFNEAKKTDQNLPFETFLNQNLSTLFSES